jgi:hypothetical protein
MVVITAELVQPFEHIRPPEFEVKIAVLVPLAAEVRGLDKQGLIADRLAERRYKVIGVFRIPLPVQPVKHIVQGAEILRHPGLDAPAIHSPGKDCAGADLVTLVRLVSFPPPSRPEKIEHFLAVFLFLSCSW